MPDNLLKKCFDFHRYRKNASWLQERLFSRKAPKRRKSMILMLQTRKFLNLGCETFKQYLYQFKCIWI